MKKTSILFILFCVGFFETTSAQQFANKAFYLVDSLQLEALTKADRSIIDSTLTIYHQSKNDSVRVFQLKILVESCENEIWIKYNQLLMDLSKKNIQSTTKTTTKNFFKKYLASGYNNLGVLFYQKSNYEKAIYYFEKTIEIDQEINDMSLIPTALNNLGFIFKQQGNILKALDYYHRALEINKKIDDKEEIALMYNNIGSLYFKQKEFEKALNYFREALLIEKTNGSEKGIARVYSNIGSVYKVQNKPKEALEYYNESYKKYSEIGLKKGQATSLSKIAVIEFDLRKQEGNINKEELDYLLLKHKQALAMFEVEKDNEAVAYSLCNIANLYKEQGNLVLAKEYGLKSLALAQKIGFPENIKNAAQILKETAEKTKNYEEAFVMQELYYQMQDSLSNSTTRDVIVQTQFQYEYEKKLIADSIQIAEKEKIIKAEMGLKDEQIKRQNTQRYALGGGVFVLLVFGGFTYKRYKKSQVQKEIIAKQKKLVELKSREITDSINYAQHIQNSILPSIEELNKKLKNGFVYYQPKDIVAGDFYWMENVGNAILFAVADCTGHGVPGAMVSIVCNSALTRAIGEYRLTQPADILNKAREIVIKTFERSGDESKLKDGMDIALCSLQHFDGRSQLQFAGANNPLWIVTKNDSNAYELIEIKPDKQPISNHIKQTDFTNHKIDLQKGDTLYIFSDGYADQFGGPKEKKLMYKPFKTFLISIQEMAMDEQKIALKNYFHQWKGDLEQVDDVCIIGVRI